jgi:sugar lactone lactonase YvrE
MAVLTLCSASVLGADIRLEVFNTTMTQIVLRWDDAIPSVVRYELQRDTNPLFPSPKTYVFASGTATYNLKIFSDTNRDPGPQQFSGIATLPLLDRDTVYYYRVRATVAGGPTVFSNIVPAQVSGPVRGVEGDLWADVVLGKPDFTQNSIRSTTAHASQWAGGVVFDHAHNRMYLADMNNNRILGFDRNAISGFSMVGPMPEQDNVARGCPYTLDPPPTWNYPDDSGTLFTDGQPSTTHSDSFGYTVMVPGWPTTVDVTVDLGTVRSINYTSFSSGGGTPGYVVGAVTIFVSANGTDWTQVGHAENPGRKADLIIAFLPTASVRYVRFRAISQQGVNGVTDWLFIGEGRAGMIAEAGIQEQLAHTPCTTNGDCYTGNYCDLTEDPTRPPDLVLGQPDLEGHSAGNNDSTAQTFPYRGPASAASLCLTHPTQISMGETIAWIKMAVDDASNLYVPDLFNNRVLRYDDPFATDAVANQVWGQNDFTGNEYNKSHGPPSASSLNLTCDVSGVNPSGTTYVDGREGAGVDIDRHGNLWVADTGNHRVLRFPRNPTTGVIGTSADLVLGQASFTTKTPGNGTSLAQLYYPTDVEVDKVTDRVYVPDGYSGSQARILAFAPPFSNGMAAAESIPMPMELELNPGAAPYAFIGQLRLDTNIHGLWVGKSTFTTELLNLDTHHSVASVLTQQSSGFALDGSGNLFTVSKWFDLTRRTYPLFSDQATVFPGTIMASADTMGQIWGLTLCNGQLVVCDGSRVLIYNNPSSLSNGQAADDLYGDADFDTITYDAYYGYAHSDASGRLWISRRGGANTLLAFTSPLTHDSVPVRQIVLSGGSLVNLEGEPVPVQGADMIDFAPVGSGDAIWVADTWHSRVFRISNLDGAVRPGADPYVDVVLGQADVSGTSANRGLSHPRADTLATPYNVAVSPDGGLYITDNGGEVGSNSRILQFDASLFPDAPAQTMFGVPASRVFGTGGSFTVFGWQSQDPICSPFAIALHPQGAMVAPMNGYSGQRFPLVCLDPLNSSLPQMALGDFMSYPAMASHFDAEGNLYVGDFDWSRLLIYKKPFKYFYEPRLPGDLNCDDFVDFDDINPFVTALVNQAGYEARYPGCRWLNGDIDGNGAVDFDDINPFVKCLVLGGCP